MAGGRGNEWLRSMAFYRSRRPDRPRSEVPDEPEAVRRARLQLMAWCAIGFALPALVSTMLVPIRDDIDRSTAALVLVLPVVFVAARGGRLPAAIAAIAAPLSFDVLLTRPYQSFDIALAADVEAAVILSAVGMTVAVTVGTAARLRLLASAREREVKALEMVIRGWGGSDEDLARRVCAAMTELLVLRGCDWAPGYRGTAYPVLDVGGDVSDGTTDRAPLPATGVEIPVRGRSHELGRLIAIPESDRPVSREERLVAVGLADLFGRMLDEPHRT